MNALDAFVAEMRGIFGDRLQSIMVYHAVAAAAAALAGSEAEGAVVEAAEQDGEDSRRRANAFFTPSRLCAI